MTTTEDRILRFAAWSVVWLLIAVVIVFFAIRATNDVKNLTSGVAPHLQDFDRRYFDNPIIAYAHILPGMVYLLGVPFQLSARLRTRRIGVHRALGRVVLPAGAITGVMAIVVGVVMPFGKHAEASATVLFGLWFLTCLTLAFRAIKRGLISAHRRWMIRAFAIGVGIGLIRIVVGIAAAFGVEIEDSFGLAFWLAFATLALLGEMWLRLRSAPYC